MSFYEEFKDKFLEKNNNQNNGVIEDIWNIFKENCQELDIDSRKDLGTYSFIFSLMKDPNKYTFSITLYMHIIESKDPEEVDENFSFVVSFDVNSDETVEDLEDSCVEYGELEGYLNTSLNLLERWNNFQALKNNFYNYRVGGKGTKYIQ
ncbi:MAG: hypothetical protein NE328_01715 [Lentisphaeraceae bacterium]|nr:hypothetical protein [Lentisphaeraceae bacterium]